LSGTAAFLERCFWIALDGHANFNSLPRGLVVTTIVPSSLVVFVQGMRKWTETGLELNVMLFEFRVTWNLGSNAFREGIVSSPVIVRC
jgi:hypothetical protein